MKYDTMYFNGCSHTAGGGLYEKYIKEAYKKLYNVEWKYEKDVTYPKYVSDYFHCKRVDDSMCGSGPARLVRKTFEYIKKIGIEKSRKTFFFLQINSVINRVEYYCQKINDYLIINVEFNEDGSTKKLYTLDNWSTSYSKYPNDYFDDVLKDLYYWFDKYHDHLAYEDKIQSDLLGLFSFLELNKIDYVYFEDYPLIHFANLFQHRKFYVDGVPSILCYANDYKKRITDELNSLQIDGHPGYFAHKEYAEKLINELEQKYPEELSIKKRFI